MSQRRQEINGAWPLSFAFRLAPFVALSLPRGRRPSPAGAKAMKQFAAVIERCPETGFYVGFVPGFPGAHTQAESIDELQGNLKEVIEMLLEDGSPVLESEFVGVQQIALA